MSLAEETREAVRRRPWLLAALQAGVVNYAAAARSLDIEADQDAVATALRRFADRLPPLETRRCSARVTMIRDVSEAGPLAMAVLAADEENVDASDLAAIGIEGPVDAVVLEHCMSCLRAAERSPQSCAWVADHAVILVDRRAAPDALRVVETALTAVPHVDG